MSAPHMLNSIEISHPNHYHSAIDGDCNKTRSYRQLSALRSDQRYGWTMHDHTIGTPWAHHGHTMGTQWAHQGHTRGTLSKPRLSTTPSTPSLPTLPKNTENKSPDAANTIITSALVYTNNADATDMRASLCPSCQSVFEACPYEIHANV